MNPYTVKFIHHGDALQDQEMTLHLSAPNKRLAAELFWTVTGGLTHNNELVSITGQDGIEAFWWQRMGTFVTIPA